MKQCKVCGKELVGKEKRYCKSCFTKGMDKAKKVGEIMLGLAVTVVSIVLKKGDLPYKKD